MAAHMVVDRWGQHMLVRLYREVGASKNDPADAMAKAVRKLLHMSYGSFVSDWRAYLPPNMSSRCFWSPTTSLRGRVASSRSCTAWCRGSVRLLLSSIRRA